MTNLLYHYCSIESFKLIMENKTFRFSSLAILDDMEESITSDFEDIGRICFVSCWTDLEQESVNMWRTYTGGNNGVRIGFPKDLFTREIEENLLIDKSKEIEDRFGVFISSPHYPELIPVTYTQDEFLINISVTREDVKKSDSTAEKFNIETSYFGRFKRNYWSGQSEWRYRLIALPQKFYENESNGKYKQGNPKQMIELMKSDLRNIPFEKKHIDYPFSEKAFNKIEVLLSPLNEKEDNQAVEKNFKKHTDIDTSEVKKSKLKIRK